MSKNQFPPECHRPSDGSNFYSEVGPWRRGIAAATVGIVALGAVGPNLSLASRTLGRPITALAQEVGQVMSDGGFAINMVRQPACAGSEPVPLICL